MQPKRLGLAVVLALGACGGDDTPKEPLFKPVPECMGEDVVAHMGQQELVLDDLGILPPEDGFDLDDDGMPDNKLGPIGTLAQGPIDDAFRRNEIVIPAEFFDLPAIGADQCVKFAFYLGLYQLDTDADDSKTARENGDCNDTDMTIHPGATEVADNFKDDDCDGKADEIDDATPSTDTSDMDTDGVTIADGDCDDTNMMVHPGLMEICGDGLDNDCDRGADFESDGLGGNRCSPFDDDLSDEVSLDPLSFNQDGTPVIEFNSGTIVDDGGTLRLHAGPSLFAVTIPINDNLLDLKITGATIDAVVHDTGGKLTITDGRIGGVFDARTMDQVRGLDVSEIGLKPEDSFLDAMFTSPTLKAIVVLPKIDTDGDGEKDCVTPDIDVDRDGREAFCDSNPNDEIYNVDTCIDGDGTVFHDGDEGSVHCTEIKDAKGNFRFVDGVSVALHFSAQQTVIKE